MATFIAHQRPAQVWWVSLWLTERMLAKLTSRIRSANRLFVVLVAAPTIAAILYFAVLASDVYISESRFVVKSPDEKRQSGLGAILDTAGFSSSGDEIAAARSYVISRDALAALERRGSFRRAYDGPGVSIVDRFDPIGFNGSFEDLYDYFQSKVRVDVDQTTSITTLKVRAYTPTDAERINRELLEMAEATVNKISSRGRDDLVRFAQAEVVEAQSRARAASVALASYRNQAGVVDPEKQAAVQMQMISKLQDELIATKTQLRQIRTFTPQNPQIGSLKVRVIELSREIEDQMKQVAGGNRSLANAAVRYQALALESEYADKQLTIALASLQDARNEARRKQVYVERIVEPNRPDDAVEPRRARGILAAFLLGLVAWGVASMLFAGVREHYE
jgi:capsular polysaccharide transport system permease protein